MTMEYRAWITVPDLPVAAEATWEPFIELLERELAQHGPILSWDDDAARVVVATDASDEAAAAAELYAAIAGSMRAAGLPGYPTAVEIEPVTPIGADPVGVSGVDTRSVVRGSKLADEAVEKVVVEEGPASGRARPGKV